MKQKIRIIRQTFVAGKSVEVGQVVEVGENDAALLIAGGKGTTNIPAPAPAKEKKE